MNTRVQKPARSRPQRAASGMGTPYIEIPHLGHRYRLYVGGRNVCFSRSGLLREDLSDLELPDCVLSVRMGMIKESGSMPAFNSNAVFALPSRQSVSKYTQHRLMW